VTGGPPPGSGPRRIFVLEGRLAVCRLPPDAPWPKVLAGPLVSITRTVEELSIVCLTGQAPPEARVEDGWRALQLQGPIPFEEIGVLSALAAALAAAGLSVFALSTFDTDYLLVREAALESAVEALGEAGYTVDGRRGATGTDGRL
jgi:hypothetical protein